MLNNLIYTGNFNLEYVVVPLFIGICIGAVICFSVRLKLGVLVRELLERKANHSDLAFSLEELGLQKNFFIRTALKNKSTYRKIISVVTEDGIFEYNAKNSETKNKQKSPKFDIDSVKFYISEDNIGRASSIYNTTGNTFMYVLLTILVFVVVAVMSLTIIPKLIDMFNALIGA